MKRIIFLLSWKTPTLGEIVAASQSHVLVHTLSALKIYSKEGERWMRSGRSLDIENTFKTRDDVVGSTGRREVFVSDCGIVKAFCLEEPSIV